LTLDSPTTVTIPLSDQNPSMNVDSGEMELDSSLFGPELEEDKASTAEMDLNVLPNAGNGLSPTSSVLASLASGTAENNDSTNNLNLNLPVSTSTPTSTTTTNTTTSSNPAPNPITSNDQSISTSTSNQPPLDFSNFDFGDLSSFADNLNQNNNVNNNGNGNGNGNGNRNFGEVDLSNLDFSSFGDVGFLNNENGEGGDGGGFENVDFSSLMEGFDNGGNGGG